MVRKYFVFKYYDLTDFLNTDIKYFSFELDIFLNF